MTARALMLWLACGTLSGTVPAAAQFDDDEFRSGLVASYQDDAGHVFQRSDAAISFDWSTAAADPRLTGSSVAAEWSGYLMSQTPGEYRLAAEVKGKVTVQLGGQVVLEGQADELTWCQSEVLQLPFDFHELSVHYQGPRQSGRLALYWSGPQFTFEPISHRQFYHDPAQTPSALFERGADLVRAGRCGACHTDVEATPLASPSLRHLRGMISRDWLVDRLLSRTDDPTRRMPHFAFTPQEAGAVADYLLAQSQPLDLPPPPRVNAPKPKKGEPATTAAQRGRELVLSVGCLACHPLGDVGQTPLFGGADLSHIARKRPPEYLAAWLKDPAQMNPRHRMPVFALSELERADVTAYLATLGPPGAFKPPEQVAERIELGRTLVSQHRCHACHEMADTDLPAVTAVAIDESVDWQQACTGDIAAGNTRPVYRLPAGDREAVAAYWSGMKGVFSEGRDNASPDGQRLLVENNCVACHARGPAGGLAASLTEMSEKLPELASIVPAMTPPALDQVGDKLHRRALQQSIRREDTPHRDYLLVRMPRFPLDETEQQALVEYLVASDRLPEPAVPAQSDHPLLEDPKAAEILGSRLVTSAGFGCTSCHQVGDVRPSQAPLNARGPDLSMVGRRIRRAWFDRFVRNPARIIPRMEMPAVKVAVRGVMDDQLDPQLAAVWKVLNTPDFQPPRPDPLRTLRQEGTGQAPAVVVTDVVRTADETFVKPLLVGLVNRHNVLYDLQSAALARWTVGDTALQRTEGKTWFWELGGSQLLESGPRQSEIALRSDEELFEAVVEGQFATEVDAYQHVGTALVLRHRLRFRQPETPVLRIEQTFAPYEAQGRSGFRRAVSIEGLAERTWPVVRVLPTDAAAEARLEPDGRSLSLSGGLHVEVLAPAEARLAADGTLHFQTDVPPSGWELAYSTGLPVDQFPQWREPDVAQAPLNLDVVPGYEAVRLPISDELMPTALAWRPNGQLVIASLKGRVWLAEDTDGDQLEDRVWPFSDELAAPYGVAAHGDAVDVINKYALLRLYDEDGNGRTDRVENLASGWGHTTDYHDWAVGLPRDDSGNYYVALPCQQDERTLAAAHLRGHVLRLEPRTPTADDPRRYQVQSLTAGHRFPMGIARRSDGELFVTDNQGNYNPFNELNHIQPGARYGFINAVERKPGFAPPLTPPAIDLPHPWTRSVNGICFLETPSEVRRGLGRDLFGPFEGHLIGCEYDTRRLVRMSLQQVGDTMQGAAYPFSYDEPPRGEPFLGPLTCAVAPDGDLYIGGIRDSGWGGANNVGELVRLRPGDGLPCGIAEVQAVPGGLQILFTAPVDAERVSAVGSYRVASYTRVSTPAYGGEDQDRRTETVIAAVPGLDGRSVLLKLNELKAGYVYEINVAPLAPGGGMFFPAEAHYTMRQVPQSSGRPQADQAAKGAEDGSME